MSKADHMLSILWMLKQRGRTAGELAEELEISVRSIYRYIDSLCASGVPIIADSGAGGGYSLPEHFIEAPLFFDSDEQRSLLQASSFARGTGYPYVKALDRAISKLKRYSNDQQLEQMERHESGIETIHSPSPPLSHLIQELELGTANGHTLQMEYSKGNGGTLSSRAIDPYGIVLWKGQWYTAAYCHQRQDIRSFRIDRIAGLQPTGAVFERPTNFSARDFLLKGLIPSLHTQENLITVVIASDEGVLNDLCSHWLFGHTLVQRIHGEARFQLDEASLLTYAPYFLLPYGTMLRIIEPLVLKEKLSAIASDLAAHYKT
jgi:predicted DNA-binding transcriptional regulator YafY